MKPRNDITWTSEADYWTSREANYFIRELRPKSFREGKKAVDKCLEQGKKLMASKSELELFKNRKKVPKTTADCKFVPAMIDCFVQSSSFNKHFWKQKRKLTSFKL